MPQLAGAHVDFTLSTVNSYIQFKDLGIRGLAMLAPERHPSAPEVPTAREQGLDAPDYCGSIFFLAPKGTPGPLLDQLIAALETSLEHDPVKRALTAASMTPDFLSSRNRVVSGKSVSLSLGP